MQLNIKIESEKLRSKFKLECWNLKLKTKAGNKAAFVCWIWKFKLNVRNWCWCFKSKVKFELGIAEWNLSWIFELENDSTNWMLKT